MNFDRLRLGYGLGRCDDGFGNGRLFNRKGLWRGLDRLGGLCDRLGNRLRNGRLKGWCGLGLSGLNLGGPLYDGGGCSGEL